MKCFGILKHSANLLPTRLLPDHLGKDPFAILGLTRVCAVESLQRTRQLSYRQILYNSVCVDIRRRHLDLQITLFLELHFYL